MCIRSSRSSLRTEPGIFWPPPLCRWPAASEPTQAATWTQTDQLDDTARHKDICWQLSLTCISPPGDDGSDAGRRHRQRQVSPVSDEVGQQGQKHVPDAPRQTHDGTSEGPVLHVCPLDTWAGDSRQTSRFRRAAVWQIITIICWFKVNASQ